ncbi:MAG: UDP-N-acetylmuramoyl-tripeptide--D-alanyl-D-alanine ligase [Proteobacteria bacterium]|nr:UDP-N-acetylmuramoyl-tripeptide--D-alanyl-D-alanine ligase [Pseudomonadota bacterium]
MWPKTISDIARILNVPVHGSTPLGATGINSLSTDSRKVAAGEIFVAIRGESHDGHEYVRMALEKGAPAAIVEAGWLSKNPEFSDRCLAVSDTTQALRVLGHAFRREFSFPVLAVGGSNGKTTTKEMLACLLNSENNPVTRTHKSENGFLGLAMTLTQKAHNRNKPPHALVAEIGIDDVGAMSEHVNIARPDVAMLTALGPEHLAGLGSWEKAVSEELVLFRNAPSECRRVWQLCEPKLAEVSNEIRAGDVIVHNKADFPDLDQRVSRLVAEGKISKLEFEICEMKATCSVMNAHWSTKESNGGVSEWRADFKIPMPGIHNAQNFALALAAAALTGRTHNELQSAWRTFTPPEMRSRVVELKKGVTLLDDCYNASPASMNAAFDALMSAEWKARHKILILGDMLDLGGESKSWHLNLIEKLIKIENSDLCLFGTAMYDVYIEIKTNYSRELQSGKIRMTHAGSETDPAQFLSELSERIAGSVVLVKGSRGMDLGRFVRSCEAWSAAQG